QPLKIGVGGGVVYVETHHDIYGYAPALFKEASSAVEHLGLGSRVDQQLLVTALEDSSGMPIRISPEPTDQPQVVSSNTIGDGKRPENDGDGTPHSDPGQAGDD